MKRSAAFLLAISSASATWLACVGDDPVTATSVTDAGVDTDTATSGSDATAETGADAASAAECDPTKPFGPKTPVSGIFQGGAVARLSQDELAIYYADFSGMFADGGASDIVVATRAKPTDSFGTPVSVGAVNTGAREEHPAITADGSRLFFLRITGEYHIYMATRGDGGLFGAVASDVPGINQPGAFDGNVYGTPAGDSVYFLSDRDGGGHIYRSALGDAGGFETPKKLAELASSGAGEGEGSPVVTADERTIYFASNRKDLGGTGSADIYMATRASSSQTFGNVARITELATSGEDEPSWISPDNCRLYLTYRPDTSSPTGIYVATRPR
jgi:hypothetical protein